MRIENEILLDYSDVLLRPKRSTLGSRKEVCLERTFTYRNYQPEDMSMEDIRPETGQYTGIPIMASNMDGVGTFEMAEKLASQKIFTCLVKTYSAPELVDFFMKKTSSAVNCTEHVAMSIGITDKDFFKFQNVYGTVGSRLKYLCVDVANGYSERFTDFIRRLRNQYSNIVIIAGNVVTADQTQELILSGADIVKVGIGPGCFLPGTIVNTIDGPKPIEEVKVGDIVKTHTGAEKPVIDTLVYDNTKPIISINGVKSTDTHEYYVLHKKYKDIATDENIHELAEWVEAKDLTKEYLLLKHK